MGRYYNGDIDGKFMFAIQSSTAADRFGSTHYDPGHVDYHFDESHLPEIKSELETLKTDFEKVEKFFEDKNSYNDKMLQEAGISSEELSNYADYRLGKQILDCVIENGSCSFSAEL